MGVLTPGLYHPAQPRNVLKQNVFPLTVWGATATLATPFGIGRDAQLRHTAASWADGTDGTMLAESPFISSPLAWLVFVTLVVASAAAIPCLAWVVRRQLPLARRVPIPLEPIVFGFSPKARRSPRHAVLQHRSLMATAFIAVLALFLLPGIAAVRGLGVVGLQAAIGLVLPTLLVVLHARQRNALR